jgi:hypothetical protein
MNKSQAKLYVIETANKLVAQYPTSTYVSVVNYCIQLLLRLGFAVYTDCGKFIATGMDKEGTLYLHTR